MLFSGPVVFMGELRGIPQREYQRDMCMWYLVKDKMGGAWTTIGPYCHFGTYRYV